MRHQRAIDLLGIAAHIAESNLVQAETYGPQEAANAYAETLADYRGAIGVLMASGKAQLGCKKSTEQGAQSKERGRG